AGFAALAPDVLQPDTAPTPNAVTATTAARLRVLFVDLISVDSFSGPDSFGAWTALEHFGHPLDLNGLIGVDVGRESKHGLVLRRAVRLEQHVHHVDRSLVVLDHAAQEQF